MQGCRRRARPCHCPPPPLPGPPCPPDTPCGGCQPRRSGTHPGGRVQPGWQPPHLQRTAAPVEVGRMEEGERAGRGGWSIGCTACGGGKMERKGGSEHVRQGGRGWGARAATAGPPHDPPHPHPPPPSPHAASPRALRHKSRPGRLGRRSQGGIPGGSKPRRAPPPRATPPTRAAATPAGRRSRRRQIAQSGGQGHPALLRCFCWHWGCAPAGGVNRRGGGGGCGGVALLGGV